MYNFFADRFADRFTDNWNSATIAGSKASSDVAGNDVNWDTEVASK